MSVLTAPACEPADTGEADADATEAAAPPPSATTVRSEMLADLGELREKYLRLADAMPESAYGWRPAEGVRSVSEVYMHIAAANFGIVMSVLEVQPPTMADPAWYDFQNAESIADKMTIGEALAASFDYVGEVIQGASDTRLQEAVDLFGRETSVRGALLLVITHCHEHLGSIRFPVGFRLPPRRWNPPRGPPTGNGHGPGPAGGSESVSRPSRPHGGLP